MLLSSTSRTSFSSKTTFFFDSHKKFFNRTPYSHIGRKPFTVFSANTPFAFYFHHRNCNFFNKIPSSHVGRKPFTSKTPFSMSTDTLAATDVQTPISLQEWQGWGTNSPVPEMVNQVIRDLKLLEKDIDAPMTFGGNHGTLKVNDSNFW